MFPHIINTLVKTIMNTIKTMLLILSSSTAFAQISAPGMGDAKTAIFTAAGIKQQWHNNPQFETMTYIGFGTKSTTENHNPISESNTLVLNHENFHTLNTHWKISYAASYRIQNQITPPTTLANDKILNENQFQKKQRETRIYGRLNYSKRWNNIVFTEKIREDVRKFHDEDWTTQNKNLEMRTRLKSQLGFEIGMDREHKISLGSEVFFATDHNLQTREWTRLHYTETRFTAFYTIKPKSIPISYTLGYMNDLIETNKTHAVQYATFNILWHNPFQ